MPLLHLALMCHRRVSSRLQYIVSGEKCGMSDIFYAAMNLVETMLYMRYIIAGKEQKYSNSELHQQTML